jgi:hypothetical protein
LSAEQLPTLDALENIAKILHRRYSSSRAYHRALFEHDPEDVYSVKLGSPWTWPAVEESSQNISSGMATKKRRTKKRAENQTNINNSVTETNTTSQPGHRRGRKKTGSAMAATESVSSFKGDRLLAKSIKFMHETMISCEAGYAVAEGDIGRAYECVKVSSKKNKTMSSLMFV